MVLHSSIPHSLPKGAVKFHSWWMDMALHPMLTVSFGHLLQALSIFRAKILLLAQTLVRSKSAQLGDHPLHTATAYNKSLARGADSFIAYLVLN
jgi:hypothetical protein